ncbi:MAG: electron transfer flavoprotein subunit alpha/FixB family protein, partial [Halobacteriaceae archaeon]
MTLDPNEYTIQELGPAIKDIDDIDELKEILNAEREGEDRAGAKQLIQSRIDKFSEEADETEEELDPTEMSPAEVGNALQDLDDVEELREFLEAERAGEDRSSVVSLIENRIESVAGSEESEETVAETPEERH